MSHFLLSRLARFLHHVHTHIHPFNFPTHPTLSPQVFAEIDRDASGTIDKKELQDALKLLRVDVNSGTVDDLFARFDGDGNGRLNYKVPYSLVTQLDRRIVTHLYTSGRITSLPSSFSFSCAIFCCSSQCNLSLSPTHQTTGVSRAARIQEQQTTEISLVDDNRL